MKKLTVILGVLLLLVLQNSVYPQVLQQWTGTFNGPGNGAESASKVAYDALGNVYTAGYGQGTSSVDYFIVKYNPAGVQQWFHTFDGSGNGTDQVLDMAVDAAGNVYVTGKSYGGVATDYDFATLKFNTGGTLLWTKIYDGPGHGEDKAVGVTFDAGGNVYVTGTSLGTANNDYATIKYSPDGTVLWTMRYNSTYNGRDDAMDIEADASGNVYVTGFSTGWGFDYATIKYSPAGVQLWEKRYNGTGLSDDFTFALAIDAAGNVYVTGESIGPGTSYDYATIKYNNNGDELWVRRYNNDAVNLSDIPVAIALDASGNVFITGNSDRATGNPDYLTIKYSPAGNQEWVQRYNGTGNNADYAKAIATDGYGNVYITGNSWGSGTGHDYVTIKYNSSGTQDWIQVYDDPLHSLDYAVSLAVGACNNVYVTGYSNNGAPSGFDIVTIKYLQPACPPVLVSPANNFVGASLTPLLDWNASLDAVTYRVQVANNSSFTSPLIDVASLSVHEYPVPPNTFATNKHYYWRVNATNAAGTSGWSSVYNFWTYSTPAEKIQMLQATIDSLKAAGILNKGQANSLTVKLNTALKRINGNDFSGAVKNIEAFKNEITDLVATNVLPPAIGNNLIERANQLISQLNGMFAFDNTPTSSSPLDYTLDQNYPNPFNPSTTIKFGIKNAEDGVSGTQVKLAVYDITGKTVAVLVNDVLKEGYYEFTFKADNLPSGIYFYKLTAGNFTSVKRMILMK